MLILMVITYLSLSFANPISHNISNTSLLRRAVPADQNCDHVNEWDGRYCDGDEAPGAWHDQCVPVDPDEPMYFHQEQCPEGEQCQAYRDRDDDPQIDCIAVPRTPDRNDVVTTKLQLGKRKFNQQATQGKKQKVGIELSRDYSGASVSAQVLDDKLSFVIDVDIFAKRRGHQDIRCQVFPFAPRTCTPGSKQDLKKGDYLDFTFGTQPTTEGWLVYQVYSGS